MKRAALLLPLMLVLGCEPRSGEAVVYAPWEEGLTLAYENPSLGSAQQRAGRLQVRVAHTTRNADGSLDVDYAYTTLQGEAGSTFRLKDGGVSQVGQDRKPLAVLLPEGFPHRVKTWVARERRYTVLGQATFQGPALDLPSSADRLGVWLESAPLDGKGLRTRTFYLPNLGEMETLEWREGRWVAVNRLVSRGFTDAPPRRPL